MKKQHFATKINLPKGCEISNYKLYKEIVNGDEVFLLTANIMVDDNAPQIVYITPKRCLHCGKDISHKDHKAKFCSNKGYGNCKDAYHNEHNPRGYGIERENWSENDEFEYGDAMEHLSACGATITDQYGNEV